jgi:hypothetical protein
MLRNLLIIILLNVVITTSLSFSINNISKNSKHIAISSIAASLLLSSSLPSQADDGVAVDTPLFTDKTSRLTVKRQSAFIRQTAYWNVLERLDFTESAIGELKTDIDEVKSDIKDNNRRSDAREEAMIARMDRDKKEANDRMDMTDMKTNLMFVITAVVALVPSIKSNKQN